MKTILISVLFAFTVQMSQSQNQEQFVNFDVSSIQADEYKIDNSWFIFDCLDVAIMPHLGGLFAKTFDEIAPNLKWTDWYNDFDFGFNTKVVFNLSRMIDLEATYNLGMLNFNNNFGKARGYNYKVSLSFNF